MRSAVFNDKSQSLVVETVAAQNAGKFADIVDYALIPILPASFSRADAEKHALWPALNLAAFLDRLPV